MWPCVWSALLAKSVTHIVSVPVCIVSTYLDGYSSGPGVWLSAFSTFLFILLNRSWNAPHPCEWPIGWKWFPQRAYRILRYTEPNALFKKSLTSRTYLCLCTLYHVLVNTFCDLTCLHMHDFCTVARNPVLTSCRGGTFLKVYLAQWESPNLATPYAMTLTHMCCCGVYDRITLCMGQIMNNFWAEYAHSAKYDFKKYDFFQTETVIGKSHASTT